MKRYFITGLIILLPLTLTLIIVSFVFNTLTKPFAEIVNSIFHKTQIFSSGFLFFSASQVEEFVSKILVFIFLIGFTLALGAIARWFYFKFLIEFAERILNHIPFINTIYKTSQDVIKTIFTSENQTFKQVVLVPYPNSSSYAIGFVTGEKLTDLNNTKHEDIIPVFVPTTPIPTSGFLLLFHEKDLTYLDMPIESALKFVISAGVILAPFKTMTKDEIDRAFAERQLTKQQNDIRDIK